MSARVRAIEERGGGGETSFHLVAWEAPRREKIAREKRDQGGGGGLTPEAA